MRILIYKRTHIGDPDSSGRFGCNDCMGLARSFEFDAVIGIGGTGAEPRRHGIDGKVNWIGLNPSKRNIAGKKGPEVTFAHFLDYGTRGPMLEDVAPKLAERFYKRKCRILLHGFTSEERVEATQILSLANESPPSPMGFEAASAAENARSRCRKLKGRKKRYRLVGEH